MVSFLLHSYQLGSSQAQNEVDAWITSFPSIQVLVEKLHKVSIISGNTGVTSWYGKVCLPVCLSQLMAHQA
jgi:hypothetical protein